MAEDLSLDYTSFASYYVPFLRVEAIEDVATRPIYSYINAASSYLQGITKTGTPLPVTFENFCETITGDPTLITAFLDDYQEILKIPIDPTQENEWTPLLEQGVTVDQLKAQVKYAFSHFLASYPYKADGKIGIAGSEVSDFLNNWYMYLNKVAEVRDSSTGPNTLGIDLAAFEKIYEAYFPNDPQGYAQTLKEYYDDVLDETGNGDITKGWFIPSQAFKGWFERIREKYVESITLSTVSTTASEDLLIIDRLLWLLIQMIDILQRISASQAERLTFLTNWQKAYGNLLLQIPYLYEGGPVFGEADEDNDTTNKDARDAINNNFSMLETKVRSKRDAVQDTAKALQSTINQSQEAANQQTNIGTTILQQLGTLLSSIYR